jgi:hypothetical protein
MNAPENPSRKKLLPKDNGKHLSADLKTFNELPTKTQEMHLLSDEAEKVTGTHRAKVEQKIKQPSQQATK